MIFAYEPVPDEESPERISVDAPGSHCLSCGYKDELLAALQDLRPRHGARLVLFGTDCAGLAEDERLALMRRVGFVPASGGLMSNLNAWENISLPVAYHAPRRMKGLFEEVHGLLEELGGVDGRLLAKLPDEMTLYERRLAAYLRALLENPDLLVVENLNGGLGPTKRERTAHFAELYHRRCPGGTFVQFDG